MTGVSHLDHRVHREIRGMTTTTAIPTLAENESIRRRDIRQETVRLDRRPIQEGINGTLTIAMFITAENVITLLQATAHIDTHRTNAIHQEDHTTTMTTRDTTTAIETGTGTMTENMTETTTETGTDQTTTGRDQDMGEQEVTVEDLDLHRPTGREKTTRSSTTTNPAAYGLVELHHYLPEKGKAIVVVTVTG